MSLTNILNKIKIGYKTNKLDITIIFIIILTILLTVGIWRLGKVRPKKEPIELSHNISFTQIAYATYGNYSCKIRNTLRLL